MSNDTRLIAFRTQSRILCLREDFLDICEGNHCAAMILSQMMHWHTVSLDGQKESVRRNAEESRIGLSEAEEPDSWVCKAHAEMQGELLNMFGEKMIGTAFSYLVEKQYLETRANPYNKLDRKKQYHFNVSVVQEAIDGLG